jgi:hypothetical protein
MIRTPFTAAVNALNLFLAALRNLEAIRAGRIRPEMYVERLDLEDENGVFMVRSVQRYDAQRLDVSGENLLWAALGVSAAAMDRALDDTFGAKEPRATDDLGAARAIVYQIRNSFAHNPFKPQWRMDERYRRVLRVAAIDVECDGSACNGQAVAPAHFGGWPGYFKVMTYCRDQIDATTRPESEIGG